MFTAETAVGQGGDLLFEEPEAHEGITGIGDAIGAKVEQQIAILVVGGGIGVGQVILVGDGAILPTPLVDVQDVFITPAEDGSGGCVLDDAGELGGSSAVGRGVPVIAHDGTGVDVILRICIQFERRFCRGGHGQCRCTEHQQQGHEL
ncbi:hypothetical protein D3C80_1383330 [compost metagenome]